MTFDESVERAGRRAIQLTRKHGVAQKGVLGAYPFGPLGSIEFLLHEVAHWMTLGRPLNKLPSRLSNQIGEVFGGIGTLSSNSLEIDTAMITYLAGWTLGYWKDPGPIVNSCRRNLKGSSFLRAADDDPIYKMMVSRWTDHRDEYAKAAFTLAKWFRPSAKLLPFPESDYP